MQKFFSLILALLFLAPATLLAQTPTVDDLQQQLNDLTDRLERAERHVATDRITWYGDLRGKVDSLHYQDLTWNPGINADFTDFFMKVGSGELGALNVFDGSGNFNPGLSQGSALDAMFVNLANNDPAQFQGLMQAMGAMQQNGTMPGIGAFRLATAPKSSDLDNDILYTTRLRLGMKAKVADKINFSGRLSMYKNWGDSTGVKVFDSWNAFTMDGSNGGATSGDWLRVERAYFDWKDMGGSKFYLSIGRRPSTYGSPSNYRENELRGGTPSGAMMHFAFDGITVGYKLGEVTGIEGQVVRFCYGQGFESQWGNGEMFNDAGTANLEDTHVGGFNIDLYNDGYSLVQLTAFRAMDVNDGFKGTFAFPTQYGALFAPTLYRDMQKFPNFNFVTRYTPSTVIGDINLAGVNFERVEENGFTWFGAVGMTQLESNGKAGMFGGMGNDAVYQATLTSDASEVYMTPVKAMDDQTNEGYGVYVGIQTPAPMGKLGLEYNFGSKYWTPFTQGQDDAIGSKLATRGHVGEAYYIVEFNKNTFLKVGGLYYDYQYTGSGSPVGAPLKVEDVKDGKAFSLMPVVDTAWDAYASLTVKF